MEQIQDKIHQIISRNAFSLKQKTPIYYGNVAGKNLPLDYPQFFGPIESASFYVKNNNIGKTRRDYKYFLLHEYITNKNLSLLDLTPSKSHSDQIQTLLNLITELISQTRLPSMTDDLASIQIIALYTSLLFGLQLEYNKDNINQFVTKELERKLAYPYTELPFDYVQTLLKQAEQENCQRSRISFRNLDKTLMNTLTFIIEKYSIPIHGLYFVDNYTDNSCCRYIGKVVHEGGLCVPREYIIFRPSISKVKGPNDNVRFNQSHTIN